MQLWIKEDRLNFLVHAVESSDSSLADIRAALERYAHTGLDARELSTATQTGLKVSLIRRLLSDHHSFMEACRPHVEVEDFAELLSHTVLASAIVPMVLVTVRHAGRARYADHRRWARRTLPLWAYVSVTGVVVYWMLYRL